MNKTRDKNIKKLKEFERWFLKQNENIKPNTEKDRGSKGNK